MFRLFVPLASLLIMLATVAWFWTGKPLADMAHGVPVELPSNLQRINQHHTLPLKYQAGVVEHWLDDSRLITIGGQLEQKFKIDVCEQRRFLLSPSIAPKPIFIGLDFSQIQSLLHAEKKFKQHMHDYLHGPILDKKGGDDDLPGFFISSDNAFGVLVVNPIEEVQLLSDKYYDEMGRYTFVSNDRFTLVMERVEQQNCQFGLLNIDVYKHVPFSTEMHYWLNNADSWSAGNVKPGFYPAQNTVTYGIASLNQHMQSCGLMKLEGDRWRFASRYFYTEKHTVGQFNAQRSTHCQKVLATFYHTPAGEVLRSRALTLEDATKPMVGIALPGNVGVKALFNDRPVKVSAGDISHYQSLFYRDIKHQSFVWHKVLGDQVSFSLQAPSHEFYLYVLGRNVVVDGATVIQATDQCIQGLCERSADVTLYHLKAHRQHISIEVNGLQQTLSPVLKKQSIALGEKPSLHGFVDPNDKRKKNEFTVVDRNGEKLEVNDLPHLLAPYSGRINAAMGNHIKLTIDKNMQHSVSQKLTEYITAMDEKPAFATVSIANANGELLVLAQTPQVNNESNYQRAGYIQSTKPINSPLTFLAGYHDGSQKFVSGSVFKLLSALLIAEKLGVNHPMVKGLTFQDWQKMQSETSLDPEFGCFPILEKSCVANGLSNFIFDGEKQTIYNRMYDREGGLKHKADTYGLKQAIRDSLNTYFAFMVDKVAPEPFYWQSAFGNDGYELTSPLRQFISQFGFYAPLKLDAGLLNSTHSNSVFTVPASKLKHYTVQSQFWRAAVGEQNRVTALQVAQFTLAIARQRLVPLSLLKSVDNNQAKLDSTTLDINPESFELVQESMLFAGKNYKALQNLPFDIYAKSGTGEISKKLNNAWMTAFVNKGNPLVITCQIGQVKGTGGDLCGQLIAELLLSENFSQH